MSEGGNDESEWTSLIRQLGQVSAVGGVVSMVISFSFTFGFFSAVDWDLVAVASFSDHITTALSYLPAVTVAFGVWYFSSQASRVAVARGSKSRWAAVLTTVMAPEAPIRWSDFRVSFLVFFAIVLLSLVAVMFFGGSAHLLALPLFLLLNVTFDFVFYRDDVRAVNMRTFRFAYLAAGIVLICFSLGGAQGASRLKCHGNEYFVSAQSARVHGCLVWVGERGIVFRPAANGEIQFYSWGSIRRLEAAGQSGG